MASSLQHCARMLLTRPSSLLAARSCVTKASESASTADVCEQLKMQDIRDDDEVMRPNSMEFSPDGESLYSGNKSQVSKKSSINDRPDEEEYSIVESARAKDFSDSLTKSNLVNLQHDLVD